MNEDTTTQTIDIVLDECESTKSIECIMKQGNLNSRFIIAQLVKKTKFRDNYQTMFPFRCLF